MIEFYEAESGQFEAQVLRQLKVEQTLRDSNLARLQNEATSRYGSDILRSVQRHRQRRV